MSNLLGKQMVKLSEEVYTLSQPSDLIDSQTIEVLKEVAGSTARERVRLCLHQGTEEPVHEMLVVHPRDAYVPPHKHLKKSETILILSGHCDYFIFSETGEIDSQITLRPYNEGGNFIFRLGEPLYHSLLIHSEQLVFFEITKGPFQKEDTKIAPWAADSNTSEEIRKFHKRLALRGA